MPLDRRRLLRMFAMVATAAALPPVLTGCGFALRQALVLPAQRIYVEGASATTLFAEIDRELAISAGARRVAMPSEADARLRLLENRLDREILSLTGDGKAREFRLRHDIVAEVRRMDGSVLLPATRFSVSRDLTFDDARVLGKQQEELILEASMREELTALIFRRLASR